MTVLLTVFLEGVLIAGFARTTGRSPGWLVGTSIVMNLLTQAILWAVLFQFWWIYLPALAIAEISIWVIETVVLFSVRPNRLSLAQAACLSLFLNGTSLALGLFLPI